MATTNPANVLTKNGEPLIMTYHDIRLLINNFKDGDDPTELMDIKYNLFPAFDKKEFIQNKKLRYLIDKKLNIC
jgi:hypothetical protein